MLLIKESKSFVKIKAAGVWGQAWYFQPTDKRPDRHLNGLKVKHSDSCRLL
jgi:hypothetical protein